MVRYFLPVLSKNSIKLFVSPYFSIAKICKTDTKACLEITIYIDIDYISKCNGDMLETLCSFVRNLASNGVVILVLCFTEILSYWEKLLCHFISTIKSHIDSNSVVIFIRGTFREINEKDLQFFLSNNIRLQFVCSQQESPYLTEAEHSILRRISDKGFRIPVVWYVNNNNINNILDTIEDVMLSNRYSGFLLPLASFIPQFIPRLNVQQEDPEKEYYIKLLVNIYKQYTYFDDVVFPLNMCLSKVKYGNFNESFLIQRLFNMEIDASGSIYLYSNNPQNSIYWKNISQLSLLEMNEIFFLLSNFLSNLPQTNITCSDCTYRALCGGEFSEKKILKSTGCAVNQFFIKAFLWQRMKIQTSFCKNEE
ncbi:MAG: hypothetical protein LBU34_16095 [Planctomycetaceae bacterium]|jgi:hypothetical protein|nr:hypothetical protein [Planctomycetaceae bacterium]